jgi:hypothetical protein
MRRETWRGTRKGISHPRAPGRGPREWNLHTALYYKAAARPGECLGTAPTYSHATSVSASTAHPTARSCTPPRPGGLQRAQRRRCRPRRHREDLQDRPSVSSHRDRRDEPTSAPSGGRSGHDRGPQVGQGTGGHGPRRMRVIVRKERPHLGAQLRFTDIDGPPVHRVRYRRPKGPAHARYS